MTSSSSRRNRSELLFIFVHDRRPHSLLQEEELAERRRDFVFFWAHTEMYVGVFCQWFPSEFVDASFTYSSCEHFMMAAKARLFQVRNILFLILFLVLMVFVSGL